MSASSSAATLSLNMFDWSAHHRREPESESSSSSSSSSCSLSSPSSAFYYDWTLHLTTTRTSVDDDADDDDSPSYNWTEHRNTRQSDMDISMPNLGRRRMDPTFKQQYSLRDLGGSRHSRAAAGPERSTHRRQSPSVSSRRRSAEEPTIRRRRRSPSERGSRHIKRVTTTTTATKEEHSSSRHSRSHSLERSSSRHGRSQSLGHRRSPSQSRKPRHGSRHNNRHYTPSPSPRGRRGRRVLQDQQRAQQQTRTLLPLRVSLSSLDSHDFDPLPNYSVDEAPATNVLVEPSATATNHPSTTTPTTKKKIGVAAAFRGLILQGLSKKERPRASVPSPQNSPMTTTTTTGISQSFLHLVKQPSMRRHRSVPLAKTVDHDDYSNGSEEEEEDATASSTQFEDSYLDNSPSSRSSARTSRLLGLPFAAEAVPNLFLLEAKQRKRQEQQQHHNHQFHQLPDLVAISTSS